MKKLLLTFLCFLASSSYAAKESLNVTFKVTGEGTEYFRACIFQDCGNPAVSKQDPNSQIKFYIDGSATGLWQNPHFKSIVWDASCTKKFKICDNLPVAFSPILCYNKKLAGGNLNITATSKVDKSKGKLTISNCKADR